MSLPCYRGRFAPTPSGALHFGSLIAALGSYLDARAHAGEWHLRIEDVDPPRVAPGSADSILRMLDALGFEWDGPVVYQSQRSEAYAAAIERLIDAGRIYGCDCSRKLLKESAIMGVDGPVYPGTCRERNLPLNTARRFRVPATRIVFNDLLAGRVACAVADECGDFVLLRADGVFTYQLAVTVDDAELGITHIVRGADLLASTPRQIVLQQALGYPTPTYLHLPVALNDDGGKLSKQTLAAPLRDDDPLPALLRAAQFLGLDLRQETGSLAEFWQLAARVWQRGKLPPLRAKR
ncbi:MAG: tRNA glutamyl-Q(34) synthetase GluQRS [Hydrogenophilales bacterium 28-61-23]|nr:MAG: tRNA glutamyl-Q(34) synthetase GluQRS [Hydrogenophilales bacterium 28-61-23]